MCQAPQVGMASCYNVSRNSIIAIISIIITQPYYISFPTEATLEKEFISLYFSNYTMVLQAYVHKRNMNHSETHVVDMNDTFLRLDS